MGNPPSGPGQQIENVFGFFVTEMFHESHTDRVDKMEENINILYNTYPILSIFMGKT